MRRDDDAAVAGRGQPKREARAGDRSACDHEAGRDAAARARLIGERVGALLRVGGTGVEAVGRWLRQELGFIAELLGEDPWLRKW